MKLERSENNKLTIKYPANNVLSKIFLNPFTKDGSGFKKIYYELYNKKGKLVSIIEDAHIAQMAAVRNNLDYREVIFEEIYEPVEVEE